MTDRRTTISYQKAKALLGWRYSKLKQGYAEYSYTFRPGECWKLVYGTGHVDAVWVPYGY